MSTSTLFAPCIADATARMSAMATAATAALTDTQNALAAPSLTTVMGNGFRKGPPVLDGTEQGMRIKESVINDSQLNYAVIDKLQWLDRAER